MLSSDTKTQRSASSASVSTSISGPIGRRRPRGPRCPPARPPRLPSSTPSTSTSASSVAGHRAASSAACPRPRCRRCGAGAAGRPAARCRISGRPPAPCSDRRSGRCRRRRRAWCRVLASPSAIESGQGVPARRRTSVASGTSRRPCHRHARAVKPEIAPWLTGRSARARGTAWTSMHEHSLPARARCSPAARPPAFRAASRCRATSRSAIAR